MVMWALRGVVILEAMWAFFSGRFVVEFAFVVCDFHCSLHGCEMRWLVITTLRVVSWIIIRGSFGLLVVIITHLVVAWSPIEIVLIWYLSSLSIGKGSVIIWS
jgi:hypothetical protein